MAGKITISTLNNDTGVLATQNGMTGIAKAWVRFTGGGSTSILASFNVSSVTYNTTGSYTVNFTTAMPDANYTPQISAFNGSRCSGISIFCNSSVVYQAPTTSAFVFQSAETSTTGAKDATYCAVSVFGN